jgi:hypothetical protein
MYLTVRCCRRATRRWCTHVKCPCRSGDSAEKAVDADFTRRQQWRLKELARLIMEEGKTNGALGLAGAVDKEVSGDGLEETGRRSGKRRHSRAPTTRRVCGRHATVGWGTVRWDQGTGGCSASGVAGLWAPAGSGRIETDKWGPVQKINSKIEFKTELRLFHSKCSLPEVGKFEIKY